ncbi:MAG TPA: c-type cytochrome, partial [Pyrinomonadaceae bacterium]|nr:c-type cytochrome [Pyrinomonadaceae bacterium]
MQGAWQQLNEQRRRLSRPSLSPRPAAFILLLCLLLFVSCARERREFRQAPPAARLDTVAGSELSPGQPLPTPPTKNAAEESAYAVNEGKRLFDQYNCTGCHFHGGGGIGPPLMDEEWIYGSSPANIYLTISEGRPNGMP